MWFHQGLKHVHTSTYRKRGSFFVDREFQLRYVLIVMASGFLGAAFSLIPLYYFLEQNYNIFFELAFKAAPGIIDQLNREQTWIRIFSLSSFFSMVVFFSFVAYRMTSRIVGPLKVLRNHLKQITRGNWRLNPIKVRDADEFQDLVEAYNYFYSSYRKMIQRDLQRLKTLNIDPSNRDAYLAWNQMLEEKNRQLYPPTDSVNYLTVIANDVMSSATHDSRRAS